MSGPAEARRCGFAVVLGAPNAGKSTLVNRLVGAKVTIVSPRAQTTRNRVSGIAVRGPVQVIFVDTPGIFAGPKRRLERAMVDQAWRALEDADAAVVVMDAARRSIDDDTRRILAALKEKGKSAIVALNNIDLVRNDTLLAKAKAVADAGASGRIFMISAEKGDGVDDLFRHVAGLMPEGPWHYPEDQLSDMPQRLLAAEITREQIFRRLYEELPHAAAVETETWEEFRNGSLRVSQAIYVERDSQRAIVLGKGGRTIKEIGEAARKELKEILGRDVHLTLRVKTREDWADSRELFEAWGLDWKS